MIATMYYFLLMVLYILVFQISNVGALDLVNTGVGKISMLTSVSSLKQSSDFSNEEVTVEATE